MPNEKKYIFKDGVMKLNPAYVDPQNPHQQSTFAAPDKVLAPISTPQDYMGASEVHQQATGVPIQLSDSTTSSLEIMQDPGFINQFQSPERLDQGRLLDGLTSVFAQYEVPIGLVNKLLPLSQYKLNFIMDDSTSMRQKSDAPFNESSSYIKARRSRKGDTQSILTRWEEAEDRLHIMIDMLAYIPTAEIKIQFLNRSDTLVLNHAGKTPEQFAHEAHMQIDRAFNNLPDGMTPIYSKLREALTQTNSPTIHYLFTDGLPNDVPPPPERANLYDGQPDEEKYDNPHAKEVRKDDRLFWLKKIILDRNAQMNPLTFMSCTDQDKETNWMKQMDNLAPLAAEIDDFRSERREVLENQGAGLPFSKGFWLCCQLAGAIDEDLDNMDEPKAFSQSKLSNLLGRQLTAQEYQYYLEQKRIAEQTQAQQTGPYQTPSYPQYPGNSPNPGNPQYPGSQNPGNPQYPRNPQGYPSPQYPNQNPQYPNQYPNSNSQPYQQPGYPNVNSNGSQPSNAYPAPNNPYRSGSSAFWSSQNQATQPNQNQPMPPRFTR